MMTSEHDISWWHKTGKQSSETATFHDGDKYDVAILGAGFTGLWTAYYLKKAEPSIRICIVEKEYPGYGASGRNGGWAQGRMAGSIAEHERRRIGGAAAMEEAMRSTLEEIARVIQEENISCGWKHSGVIFPAMNNGQMRNLLRTVEQQRKLTLKGEEVQVLSRAELQERINLQGAIGGTFDQHCAVLNPYQLVQGLVDILQKMGVTIFQNCEVKSVCKKNAHKEIVTQHGSINAEHVVMALEAYASQLHGYKLSMLPLHNHMIVTEQIPDFHWNEIGLKNREAFEDGRKMVYYGQRTADNRIAIGGLSAPYLFGSKINTHFEHGISHHKKLLNHLKFLFPVLNKVKLEHRWTGVLGVPRNLYPSVGYDKKSNIAWCGGYIGQGVSTTNLGARTLADLILERPSELCELPWVNQRSKDWEREPLRWIGTKALGLQLSFLDWIDSLNLK